MTAISELQKRVGVKDDGLFGPGTLKAAQVYFKLSKSQAAHFFGQCAHETGGFNVFVENLNYSADGLRKIFGKYFPNAEIASQYARQPIRIASRVYAGRMGNGDESTQDGWKYRGRGALQVTGHDNVKAFSVYVNDPSLIDNPDPIADKYAFDSALWFFAKNGLWTLCNSVDDHSILNVTKKVNGGTNGIEDRKLLTKKFYSWL